jgi:hypothetical protein
MSPATYLLQVFFFLTSVSSGEKLFLKVFDMSKTYHKINVVMKTILKKDHRGARDTIRNQYKHYFLPIKLESIHHDNYVQVLGRILLFQRILSNFKME